jgi:hypothetical protein
MLTLRFLVTRSPMFVPFFDLLPDGVTRLQSQFNDCRNTIPSGSDAAIRFEQG